MENAETLLASILWIGGKMDEAPKRTTYVSKHYQMTVGIGNNHTATITIDEDSLRKLCKRNGYPVSDFIKPERRG